MKTLEIRMNKNIKVVHGVTVSKSLGLMNNQVKFLLNKDLNVQVVSSAGKYIESFKKNEGSTMKIINMKREISLYNDIKALIKLVKYFKEFKPDIVNAGTPKAGLLLTIAAWLTRVPVRIYTIRGLRLETTFGMKKYVLLLSEKIASYCATSILVISPSLKERVTELRISPPKKLHVLGNGSSNGIDLEKFKLNNALINQIENLKADLNIKEKDFVLGFVGRITKDKGINELVSLFKELNYENTDIKLLIVGDFETGDPISIESKNEILNNDNIIYIEHQENPVPYYYLMSLFMFLTNREGFGNVSIEAALCGVPVITKNVTGAKDTVLHEETGYILNSKNGSSEMKEKILKLYNDRDLLAKMGNNGNKWVKSNFSSEYIHQELYKYYITELNRR
jgi:glycosyltransferase involved in cell wall biosynthesis